MSEHTKTLPTDAVAVFQELVSAALQTTQGDIEATVGAVYEEITQNTVLFETIFKPLCETVIRTQCESFQQGSGLLGHHSGLVGHNALTTMEHAEDPLQALPQGPEPSIPWREAFPQWSDAQLPGVSLAGARHREGLTQMQLARLTGIPQRHLSEMEHGKRPIGKERAKVLAQMLHVDYRIFL
jgi:hypothetical protein